MKGVRKSSAPVKSTVWKEVLEILHSESEDSEKLHLSSVQRSQTVLVKLA